MIDQIPLVAYLGIGGLIAIAALWFASPVLIPLWNAIPKPAKVAILFTVALLSAFVLGRNKAARDFKEKQAKLNAQAESNRREVHDEIEVLKRPDVDKRLDKWMRD